MTTPRANRQRGSVRHGRVMGRAYGAMLGALALLASSCMTAAAPVRVDPALTFAAHETHAGLVIDRAPDGRTGLAEPQGGFHLEPVYVLRTGDGHDEQLRVMGPGRVVVERRAAASEASQVGLVEPTWENNAIRLTIRPADGPPIQSGLFRRTDQGAGTSVLSRLDQDRIDLEGAYQATLRAPDGTSVGSFGLIVGKGQPGHVMYEGILPRDIDGGLAAATAAALGSEIAFIEAQTRGVSRKPEER